ncbi:hypothetical protein QE152_g38179 [Popillia japonica]|uniref:Uncharacterized protein n=1 Tax=Popillia japonica TaxID=7064 RepID=A0AAW1I8J5_POPJA
MICRIESGIHQLDEHETETIIQEVSHILRNTAPPKKNVTRNEYQALKTLNNDEIIIILPADKRNATVVMNRTVYEEKMNHLILDTAYQPITSDPTTNATVVMNRTVYEEKMNHLILDTAYQPITSDPTTYLEKTTRIKIKNSLINEVLPKQLIPREKSSKCPKMYGLPKIHKQDVSLRPIVSSIGSLNLVKPSITTEMYL